MRLFLLLLAPLLFASCAAQNESVVREYRDYLLANQESSLTYDRVVDKLGEPAVRREHRSDVTASWMRTYRIESDESVHGEKIIIEFDPVSKLMLNWRYKEW